MNIHQVEDFKFFVDKDLEKAFSEIIIEHTKSWFRTGFVVRVKD